MLRLNQAQGLVEAAALGDVDEDVSDENMYLYTYMVTITNNAVALIEMKF
jgi:hypothetical protein